MKKNKKISITKILKKIGLLLKAIYNIFDKIIIMPISRFVYFITDKTSNVVPKLEKALSRQNFLVVISLILAFLTFVLFDTKAVKLVNNEALVLNNQSVKAEYNEEAYVIEGIPKSVDITLMGRKSDLYLAKQLGEHIITMDMKGLGVGTHKVKLKYNNRILSLDYKLDPSYVTVVVYPKVSAVKTLQTDIVNTDKIDNKLIISDVTLSRNEVIVKSSEEILKKVASVKALIDVTHLGVSEAGTYTLENTKLIAYDQLGKEVKNVEIVPNKVNATVIIDSPNKEVPIKVIPKGNVKTGSAIKSIETNITKVTIYGNEETLANITFLPIEIDVSNLGENKRYRTTIKRPSGVKSVSETNITIDVTVESQASKDFKDVTVEFRNLGDNYRALVESEEDQKVIVSVKGVSTLLSALQTEDIIAYVDLKDYTSGTYDVPVIATGRDNKLTYSPKTKTIKIIIK